MASGRAMQLWKDRFKTVREAPPGGWARYLDGASWKGEWFRRYNYYLRSWSWEQKRRGALRRAEGKCQLCSATTALQVHHVTYARVCEERIEDFRVLCAACHKRIHASGKPFIPLDHATRRERDERRTMHARKLIPAKPHTRRRPGGVRPAPADPTRAP